MSYYFTANIRQEIGKNLRQARKKLKYKQISVAEASDTNEGYYSKVEQGQANITLEKFYKIVRALGVRSSDILPF